jgi:O-antigen biosynthesis protein
MTFNPLDYSVFYDKPQRLTEVNSWHEHIPFAFVVMQMLKPKIFVELGTHKGDSYCAFCQAVETLGLDTTCTAVDTWGGDEQSGYYGPEILEQLQAYHDPLYGRFSRLIQSRFDQALDLFSDGSIDLLHIDGLHIYDAVKHDFESWLPKMSTHGIVLLHDTNVHEKEFGVWRLWQDLKERYPSFEFSHGNGLGVLAVGSEMPKELIDFFDAGKQESKGISNFFSSVGNNIALSEQLKIENIQISELTSANQTWAAHVTNIELYSRNLEQDNKNLENIIGDKDAEITNLSQYTKNLENIVGDKDAEITNLSQYTKNLENIIGDKDAEITNLSQYIKNLENIIGDKDAHITNLTNTLQSMQESSVWKILTKFHRGIVEPAFPSGTRRRRLYDLGFISTRVLVNDGPDAFLFRIKEKMGRRTLNEANIPVVEIKMVPQQVSLSLIKKLTGKFSFPLDNLSEIRILTTTNKRRNADLELHVANNEGTIIRKSRAKGYRILDNDYTSFNFKPIKNSKDAIFSFNLISRKEPSAGVWYNESIVDDDLQLFYDEKPITGLIGFQAFADIGLKSQYDLWILKNEQPVTSKPEHGKEDLLILEYQPKISIITTIDKTDIGITAAIESVINQIYEKWELCIAVASLQSDVRNTLESYTKNDARIKIRILSENRGISRNFNEALSLATGEYIGLLHAGDELSPDALYEVVRSLQNNCSGDMIYSDEDKIDCHNHRSDPFFKPDWSPDLFVSWMYTGNFGVYNKKIIDKIGGFREEYNKSGEYDLALRFIEKTDRIHHIPKVLYHRRIAFVPAATALGTNRDARNMGKKALTEYMKRNSIEGEVSEGLWIGSYNLKRKLLRTPLVSVIVPTKDNVVVLKRCIDSIFQKTSYTNYEIIIVDNNSKDKKTYDYFREIETIQKVKILKYEKEFNFSAINNFAVKNVSGEILLFLNNDTEVITNDWMTAMLEHAQQSEVGAVGCKLLYPDNTIQHSGVILGINSISIPFENGVAEHAHKHFPKSSDGYFGRLNVIQNFSAVTAACMMVRKELFEKVGGFDEQNLKVSFNDIDLCLKIRELGYRIVYTPYAELYHYESLSRGYEDTQEKSEQSAREFRYMREKWGEKIDKGDPYYNSNLSLRYDDFRIKI